MARLLLHHARARPGGARGSSASRSRLSFVDLGLGLGQSGVDDGVGVGLCLSARDFLLVDESGTARLEEAVAAYRAALEEYTRERVPLQWATTQNNLGNALATLARRQKNTALLEEALVSMRGAVEVYQQAGEGYWLPIARRRVAELEAELAEMQAQTNCNG